MQANLSVAKKLCAMVLSLLMIIGTIPVSYAANPDQSKKPASSVSTPDEAKKPDSTGENGADTEEYPNVTVNDSAKSYKDSLGNMYYLGTNLKTMTVKMKPSDSILSAINADLGKGNKNAVTVLLEKGSDTYSLGSDCTYSTANNLFTVKIDLTKQFPSGLSSGEYKLTIKYKKDDNNLELFSKSFKSVTSKPSVSDLRYNGKTKSEWSSSDVNITFGIGSEIVKSVTVNDTPVGGSNGKYSYTAVEPGKYTIVATDQFDRTTTIQTAKVLIDKTAPAISEPVFLDGDGNEVEGWTNKDITVQLDITDSDSGVDSSSVKVNDEAPSSVEAIENGFRVKFKAEDRKDYSINCVDNVKNSASKDIKKEKILIDKDAPTASDFTLEFDKAEDAGDKVLSILSFGMYSNSDINVTVNVDDNGMSEIDTDSIELFNGSEKLQKAAGKNNVFVLKKPEGEDESNKFTLKVKASDKAGNESTEFSVEKDDVKTKISEDTITPLKDLSEELYEIVISNIVPSFVKGKEDSSVDKVNYEFERKTKKDTQFIVAGNGKLSVAIEEVHTGIKSVKALINDKEAEVTTDKTDLDKTKVTSLTAQVEAKDLKNGKNTIVFKAVSNSGNESEVTEEFTVDNDGPKFDGNFEYSNTENKAQKWVNSSVDIFFNLSDVSGVKKIKYYNSTKVSEPKDSDYTEIPVEPGKQKFTVNEYGKYTVVAEDELGNVSKNVTEIVLIDKEAPEVVDDKFDFSKDWTNKSVTVNFKTKDNPSENSGVKEVVIDGKTKAEKTADGYKFTADHYGKYKVVLYDNATNFKDYTTDAVNIDDIKPSLDKVEFSEAKNKKEYGIYNNEALTMTLTVTNTLNDANEGSDIDKIEIREKGKAVASEFTKGEGNSYTVSYVITPDNDIHNFTFYAKDKAGNEIERELTGPDLAVEVDSSSESAKKLYEVVSTEQKAKITNSSIKFSDNGKLNNGILYYHGEGTITAKIKDALSGIDSYKAYFGLSSKFTIDGSGKVTDFGGLEPVASEENISKDEKKTETEVSFTTSDSIKNTANHFMAVIVAKNLSGNESQKVMDIYVDNSAPKAAQIEFITSGGSEDDCNKNGIYSAKPIKVRVKTEDGEFSSGIDSIELFNGSESLGKNSTGEFELSGHKAYKLFVLVTDKNGNKLDGIEDIKTKPVLYNGNPITVDENNFEVICNSEEGDCQRTEIDFNFENKGDCVYKSSDGKDAEVLISLKNDFFGITDVKTEVKDSDDNSYTLPEPKVIEDSVKKDDYGKVVFETVSQDVKTLPSGSYTIITTVTDKSGTKHTFEDKFGIDKTAPQVESVSFEKTDSAGANLLNILTFGLYSSENVKVTVVVSDEKPSSGITQSGVVLQSAKGKSIDEDSFVQLEDSADGKRLRYQKVFFLEVEEGEGDKFSYNDLNVTVKDIFNNTLEKSKYNSSTNYFNGKEYNPGDDFDINLSKSIPTVSDFKQKGTDQYKSDNGEYWYSAGPEIDFEVTDTTTNLHSVEVSLNGKDVSSYCTVDGKSLPEVFTDFTKGLDDEAAQKIPTAKINLATAGEGVSSFLKNGKNELSVTATANNGLSCEAKKLTFYVFFVKPEVEEGSVIYSEDWTNNKVPVQFTANAGSYNILKKIEVFREGSPDESVTVKEYKESDKVKIADFKFYAEKYGKYKVKLTDFANHETTTDLGVVNIDTKAPSIMKIMLDSADSSTLSDMGYGAYSNGDIKMTVSVYNPADEFGGQSPLSDTKAVKATVNGVEPKFIGRTEGTNDYVFVISSLKNVSNSDLKVIFDLEDTAGNNNNVNISDSSVPVVVNDVLRTRYEILSTIQTSDIDDIQVEFKDDNGDIRYEDGKYSGNGTFKTTITDKASGVDRYYTYFMKTSDVPSDLSKLKDEDALTSKTDISKSSKVQSVNVEFNSTETNTLKSGKYTAVVVAYNINSNRCAKRVDIEVNNDPPKITKVNIKTENGRHSSKGVYSSKDVAVEIEYAMGEYNAPIKSVQLTDKNGNFDKTNTSGELGKFTLTKDGVYDLCALVTDKYGNCKTEAEAIKNVPITVNGEELGENDGYFEVVINRTNKAENTKDDFTYNFQYDEKAQYHIFGNKNGKNGKVSVTLQNTVSGIYDITAAVTKKDESAKPYSVKLSGDTLDKYGKFVKRTAEIDVSSLDTGEYLVSFTAEDYGEIKYTFSQTIYIDKTAPVIDKIVYDESNNTWDRILNILTFGLYSSNDIDVTVYVTDNNPSATIANGGISLKSESGKNVKAVDGSFQITSGKEDDTALNSISYKKTFVIEAGKDANDSFYNDLSVTATDLYDNSVTKKAVDCKNYNGKDSKNEYIDTSKSGFDIVASTKEPEISINITEQAGTGVYSANGNNVKETQGRFFAKKPIVNFTLTDNVSKLHSVKVSINGKDVTSNCEGIGANGQFTDFITHTGSQLTTVNGVLKTENTNVINSDGEYTVKVEAVSNNEKRSEKTFTFIYDTTNPVVTRYTFENNQQVTKLRHNSDALNYYYFFKESTTVTINATDNVINNVKGSGVNTMRLRLFDIDAGKVVSELSPKSETKGENYSATFAIPGNFRGYLRAYAIDNVKNNSNAADTYSPDNVVIEKDWKNIQATDAEFSIPNTSKYDAQSHPLYSDYITVSINAKSDYAGIEKVEVFSASQRNKSFRLEKTVNVSLSGNVTNGTAVSYLRDKGKNTNLVTKVHTDVPIRINDNEIQLKVKVTDRTGYYKEILTKGNKIFSIDKTSPTIKVDQTSAARGNTVGSDTFFNKDVTLTITVTERNFDPRDLDYKITNTDGTIPSIRSVRLWQRDSSANATYTDETTHVAEIVFHSDGDYTFDCSYTDLAGNKNRPADTAKKFTVDQTVPKISITYDPSSSYSYHPYYNRERVATITIEEHNFIEDSAYLKINQTAIAPNGRDSITPPSVSGWSRSGNISRATITFKDDGKFSFTVNFKDKALNDAVEQKSEEFYIDNGIKKDQPEFRNVEDHKPYNKEIAPEIVYFDYNLKDISYKLERSSLIQENGVYKYVTEEVKDIVPSDDHGAETRTLSFANFEKVVKNDGVYTLTAKMWDKAGNSAESSILFSVNRFGSTFMLKDEASKELVKNFYGNRIPDIKVSEINVNKLSAAKVSVIYDEDVTDLSEKQYEYQEKNNERKNWYEYEYTIKSDNFKNEGQYTVTVSSTNEFKQTISNRNAYKDKKIDRTCPISFEYDKTEPEVKITGVKDGEPYGETEKNVTIICNDVNIDAKTFEVLFDDEKQEAKADSDNVKIESKITLKADGKDSSRKLQVVVYDKANNKTVKTVKDFSLNANWIVLLFHYNWPLLVGVGAALAVLAGLLIFLKNKKKKNAAE